MVIHVPLIVAEPVSLRTEYWLIRCDQQAIRYEQLKQRRMFVLGRLTVSIPLSKEAALKSCTCPDVHKGTSV